MKRVRLYTLLMVVAALSGCSKGESVTPEGGEPLISFGCDVAELATRVTVADKDENGRYKVSFDEDDRIGLYLYYNNFFEYYSDYNSYAESVLFANQELVVTADKVSASYTKLKSWTFSTLYGTAPYRYDAIAYYPFATDGSAQKWGGTSSHIFRYTYDPTVYANHCDFMIGTAKHNESSALDFRTYILANPKINLSFTREMASINFAVSKADKLKDEEIKITKLLVTFDSFETFEYDQSAQSGVWKEDSKITAGTVEVPLDEPITLITTSEGAQNDGTINHGSLELANKGDATITDDDTTSDTDNPDITLDPEDVYDTAVRLSKALLKKPLYFPPTSVVKKIDFTITVDGVEKTYTWHPHIKVIEKNTSYLLNLELDPDRKN